MKREELKRYTSNEIEEIDDALLEASEDGTIKMTRVYIASEADNVMDAMEARIKELDESTCKDCPKLKELESMNANINNRCIKMEGVMRLLQEENARLNETISKMENVDERREYNYEMDIVIRWLDKNEDFVTEPNGKMQLLKSKAMLQKIKWLDEHPRTQNTDESSAAEKENG